MKYLKNYILIILSLLSIFRIIFYLLYNPDIFNFNNLINSMIQGLRYDIASLSYLIVPFWILLLLQTFPSKKKINNIIHSITKNYLIFLIIIITIFSIIDIGFYYEFKTRINYLAIEYLLFIENTMITIIKSFPYNFLLILMITTIIFSLLILSNIATLL